MEFVVGLSCLLYRGTLVTVCFAVVVVDCEVVQYIYTLPYILYIQCTVRRTSYSIYDYIYGIYTVR